jgi:hypothetical protein
MVEYLPLPPPKPLGPKPTCHLSPEHEAMRVKVVEHFSNKEYTLPAFEGDKALLTDREKCWLVRPFYPF